MPNSKPLLIGVSARIYTPGTAGINVSGVWTKTLHYLEQSVAHWVLSGGAVAVMVPAVTRDSIVMRSDLNLHDYAQALDGLVLQGGNDVAPESYGEEPLTSEWHGDRVRDLYEMDLVRAFVAAGKPVFDIEYDRPANAFCPVAASLHFYIVGKDLDLSVYVTTCD